MMWWRIANFIFLFGAVYMELALGVKIAEQIDATTGVCFAGIATTISVLGYMWLERFRVRRTEAAKRLRQWQDIVQKMQSNGNKIMFHNPQPDLYNTMQHYRPRPSANFVIDKDGIHNA